MKNRGGSSDIPLVDLTTIDEELSHSNRCIVGAIPLLLELREDITELHEEYKQTIKEVNEDCDRQLQELFTSSFVESSVFEETCSSQREEISVFHHQLAAATQKLKMADLSSSELSTEHEERKRVVSELQERLREGESLRKEHEEQTRVVSELQERLREGESLRKELHNTILELKGNIRVFCRVRPLIPDDGPGAEARVSYPTSIDLAGRGIDFYHSGDKHPFTFDKVFAPDASQQEVFMEISQLVQSALDGYKVSIFAYGQTGSGKTYTMMGRIEDPLHKGLIPRSLEQVFQTSRALAAQGWKYKMQASMMEIYNEKIRDLLSPRSSRRDCGGGAEKQHDIKLDADDLTIVDVCSLREVSNLLQQAAQSRSVAKTNMNENSSRSHFVFSLKIDGVNESTKQQVQGVLNFIDLAGSERAGDRIEETKAINSSLHHFGLFFAALANKKNEDDHVPYRNSLLTRYLKPYLEEHSKAIMLLNVSLQASSVGESLCSLRFASSVMKCVVGPHSLQSQVKRKKKMPFASPSSQQPPKKKQPIERG